MILVWVNLGPVANSTASALDSWHEVNTKTPMRTADSDCWTTSSAAFIAWQWSRLQWMRDDLLQRSWHDSLSLAVLCILHMLYSVIYYVCMCIYIIYIYILNVLSSMWRRRQLLTASRRSIPCSSTGQKMPRLRWIPSVTMATSAQTTRHEDHEDHEDHEGWGDVDGMLGPCFFCIFFGLLECFSVVRSCRWRQGSFRMKQKHQKYGMLRRLQGLCRHTRINHHQISHL